MNTRGVVYVEFLICFVPLFVLFLGGVQLAFLVASSAVVRHAAYRAARMAVVTIDDDPLFYDCAQRGLLDPGGRTPSTQQQSERDGTVNDLLGSVGQAYQGLSAEHNTGGPRVQAIRAAAYLPLAAIAPEPGYLLRVAPFLGGVLGGAMGGDGLRQSALGDHPLLRVALGYFVYSKMAAAVTFPEAPGARHREGVVSYGPRELVTTRVRYLYLCAVPIARHFMCRSLLDMTGLPDSLDEAARLGEHPPSLGTPRELRELRDRAQAGLERFNELHRELMHAEWGVNFLLPATQARFAVLTGEARLPNQGAPYRYWSELGGECADH